MQTERITVHHLFYVTQVIEKKTAKNQDVSSIKRRSQKSISAQTSLGSVKIK